MLCKMIGSFWSLIRGRGGGGEDNTLDSYVLYRTWFFAVQYAFLQLKFKLKPVQEMRIMSAELLVFVSIKSLNDYSTAGL